MNPKRESPWPFQPLTAVRVILKHAELSTLDKLVGIAIVTYDGADRWAFPSVTRLAADVHYSERHVRRSLRRLEAAGIIFTLHLPNPGRRHSPNHYTVLVGRLAIVRDASGK
jgi:hypothetical protein